MKRLRVLAWLWVGLLIVTGAAGAAVVSRVGWSLAMALAIYGGNTEPARPVLAYPWGVFALGLAAALAGLGWQLWERRLAARADAERQRLMPLVVAYLGGLLTAILPFVQLARLWSRVG
jgi:hypothetical protein